MQQQQPVSLQSAWCTSQQSDSCFEPSSQQCHSLPSSSSPMSTMTVSNRLAGQQSLDQLATYNFPTFAIPCRICCYTCWSNCSGGICCFAASYPRPALMRVACQVVLQWDPMQPPVTNRTFGHLLLARAQLYLSQAGVQPPFTNMSPATCSTLNQQEPSYLSPIGAQLLVMSPATCHQQDPSHLSPAEYLQLPQEPSYAVTSRFHTPQTGTSSRRDHN